MSTTRHRTTCRAVTGDLLQSLRHVATFGDTDQVPGSDAIELRTRGLIAGSAVAPFVTGPGCALLDQLPASGARGQCTDPPREGVGR